MKRNIDIEDSEHNSKKICIKEENKTNHEDYLDIEFTESCKFLKCEYSIFASDLLEEEKEISFQPEPLKFYAYFLSEENTLNYTIDEFLYCDEIIRFCSAPKCNETLSDCSFFCNKHKPVDFAVFLKDGHINDFLL
jgi:hypothetical protein